MHKTAEALLEDGMNLLADGRAGEAAAAFRTAIDADEHCMDAHHGLIRALREIQQHGAPVLPGKALRDLAHGAVAVRVTPYDSPVTPC